MAESAAGVASALQGGPVREPKLDKMSAIVEGLETAPADVLNRAKFAAKAARKLVETAKFLQDKHKREQDQRQQRKGGGGGRGGGGGGGNKGHYKGNNGGGGGGGGYSHHNNTYQQDRPAKQQRLDNRYDAADDDSDRYSG